MSQTFSSRAPRRASDNRRRSCWPSVGSRYSGRHASLTRQSAHRLRCSRSTYDRRVGPRVHGTGDRKGGPAGRARQQRGYAMMAPPKRRVSRKPRRSFETNFFGIVRMVNAVLPGMRAAGAGKIINISSLAGNTAIPFSAFYSATKFAVEGYSESLWHEVRPFGISVSLVEPGFVNTPIGEAFSGGRAGTPGVQRHPQAHAREVWPVPGGWHSAGAGRAERAPDRREQVSGTPVPRGRAGDVVAATPQCRAVEGVRGGSAEDVRGVVRARLPLYRKPGARAVRLSCARALKTPARRRLEPLRARVVAEPRLQPTDSNSITSTLAC